MPFHEVIQNAAGTAGQVAGSAFAAGEDTLQEAEEEQQEQEQAAQDVATGFATGNLGQAFAGTSELAEDQAAAEAAAQEDSGGGGNALDWAWGGLTDAGSAVEETASDAVWSVPQQFDDEAGGGLGDWAGGGLAEESGLREWQDTETFRELNEQVSQGGILDRIDAGAQGAIDFTLDNPNFSVQDTARAGLVEGTRLATGNDEWEGEDLATAVSSTGSNLQGGLGDALSGTPLDNPGTDALTWLGEAVAVEPGKAVLGGSTGLDVDEGDTEATVGAMDAFDIGVGAATLGGGTLLARGAARGSDEGAGLLGRIFGGGSDEGAQAADDVTPALPAPDEAAQAADEGGAFRDALPVVDEGAQTADEAAQASDEGGTAFRETVLGGGDDAAQGADNLPAVADDAAQAGDDVVDDAGQGFLGGTLAPGFAAVGRLGEDFLGLGARGADEAATAADDVAQGADDSGSLFDNLLGRGSDDAAAASDEGGQAATQAAEETAEEAGRFRRFLGTRTGQVTAGAGALVGGGAVYQEVFTNPRNAPDEIETENGEVLTASKTYEPTNRFPNGGRLYEVRRSGSRSGYWTLLGRQGRNLIVLDSTGDTRQAQISVEQFRELVQGGQGGNQ